MNTRIALLDSIETLYRVFVNYSAEDMFGCPHCVTAEHIQRTQAKPLRELTGEDLSHYAFNAITTMGTEDNFRFFLPRLLELFALEGGIGRYDAEPVIGKLPYTHWERWDRIEREAIMNFFHALLREVFEKEFIIEMGSDKSLRNQWESLGWAIYEPLTIIERAEIDLVPFLTEWLESTSPFAVYRLAAFLLNDDLIYKDDAPGYDLPIINWLKSDPVYRYLETYLFTHSDAPFRDKLTEAIAHLCAVRA